MRKKSYIKSTSWRIIFILFLLIQFWYKKYCENPIYVIFYRPVQKSKIPSQYFLLEPNDILTHESDFKIKISYSCACQSNHTPLYSTPNDLVMTLAKKSLYNSLMFLKTFRTHCQAALVIFVDSIAYYRYKSISCFFNMQSQCHFYLVCFSKVKIKNRDFLRNYLYYQFILSRQHLLNRVIICDLYDTIFQGDPFLPTINWNVVGLTREYVILFEEYLHNVPWVRDVYAFYGLNFDDYSYKFKGERVTNGGIIYGTPTVIINFYKIIYDDRIMIEMCNDNYQLTDQGYFMYFSKEILPKHPEINISISDWTGHIVTIGNVPPDLLLGTDSFWNVTVKGGKSPPALVHQFDRHTYLYKHIKQSCPSSECNSIWLGPRIKYTPFLKPFQKFIGYIKRPFQALIKYISSRN